MSTSKSKTYHHGDLAPALVDTGLALLAEVGADLLSLREVARRAEVSATAPYRHFPDKEALLAAIAIRGFDDLRDALQAADASAPPGEQLVEQAVAYVGYACANPALFRLMFGPFRKARHPALVTAGEAAYAILAMRVRIQFNEPASEARVIGCWSLVHGLASLMLDKLLVETPGSTDDAARRVVRAMLDL